MRKRVGRASAIAGLLLAIFADLRRRAWWAYRAGGIHRRTPLPTVIAQRATAPKPYAPRVTTAWRKVADAALSVHAAAMMEDQHGAFQPVVWIDVGHRPDIADLPRVLRTEQGYGSSQIVATQWLADVAADNVVAVITYIDPVSCTWAMRFDLRRWHKALEQIVADERFAVAFAAPPGVPQHPNELLVLANPVPAASVSLPVNAPSHLRAILDDWASHHAS